MADSLTAAERSTIVAIVDGIQRSNRKRRSASRSGWALLATAGVSLPIIAGALDQSISLSTALMRVGMALGLSLFVAMTVGSMMDHYQTQAALDSVGDALLTAREMATDDPPDSTDENQHDR